MITDLVVAVISTVIGFLRIAGMTGNVYKDIAHVWVGILMGSWISLRYVIHLIKFFGCGPYFDIGVEPRFRPLMKIAGMSALVLIVVECICFVIKFLHR
jgi:hypothetical protein